MKGFLGRAWMLLVGRTTGPMRFRFVLQPIVAVALAARAGRRDAARDRSPYLKSVWTDCGARRALVRDAWNDIARLCAMALVIDVVYQLVFLGWFYPLQGVIVACAVAVAPYVVLRGPITRLLRARRHV